MKSETKMNTAKRYTVLVLVAQTDLQEGLAGHKGITFSLQDVWFSFPSK